MSYDAKYFSNAVQNLRQKNPLVHNITNYVVMNWTANALLAVGASPLMAHASEEVCEFVKMSQALVVNIGTISESWLVAMESAVEVASQSGTPWILDPVGVGATAFRRAAVLRLLQKSKPSVIRGNASEILALQNLSASGKGVDATAAVSDAMQAARELAQKYECTVVVSGEVDAIVSTHKHLKISHGVSQMAKVTGAGCAATALIGAFLGAKNSAFESSLIAMTLWGLCGEKAKSNALGLGSFAVGLLDALSRDWQEGDFKNLRIS